MRNRLEVDKVEALVYIYTNSHLLCQRPSVGPVRYYDDNIFSEDSDDDGGALLETDDNDNDGNDDNNGNGGKGHDGNDGDSSNERGQYQRADPLVILQDPHLEAAFDWNGIDEEIENGVDEYTIVGPIGNMHVNEEAPVRSDDLAYDWANEEPNDDDYDEVTNEHGIEDGNTHGRNGDGNDAVKVVVLALQLVATMMQPLLAMRMVDIVIFSRNNEPKKLQTKEYRLKTFHLYQIRMLILRFLMLPFQ